ncbi:hypothetical protein Ddye_013318 [Dipteronia dyeriana]|uniref:PTC1-like winged helix-turn-helix domain-containing protein n=1 Tax=Dipteronia dyeriana TaxID=168575 RepID=A0AAD9X679_9ROSI|nr:hypothetical protein Ddye_013318 [Dipteronia dyeriana]
MDQSCSKVDDNGGAAISLTDMMYLKGQQNNPTEAAAKSPPLAVGNFSYSLFVLCFCFYFHPSPLSNQVFAHADVGAHIKVYSYYAIDNSKLPSMAPDQLKSIRVVMVTEKCKNGVGVRFPSMCSLQAHFTGADCRKPGTKLMPSLDENYMMEPEVAEEVLYRRVSPYEIGENRNSMSFWLVGSDVKVFPKEGLCCSVLKSCAGMLKWGKKRKVQFQSPFQEEKKNEQALSVYVRAENEGQEGMEKSDDDKEEEVEEEEDDDDEKSDQLSRDALRKNLKRKCNVSANIERPKREKKKMKLIKSSSGRWSKERYKLAEVNMLKILKEKGAVFGRSIMRPALRAEARKLIGDTGLLDHLLKHMAGKVAPGGQERFRRRHNADGAMEYWLESADLVNIRKDAGVQDPYWTPPPGWSPGDNPTQDPVCAMEIKQLKEDIAKMSRDMQDLLSKKREDDIAMVTTPTSCITSQTLEHNGFLLPMKEMYTNLMNKKAKVEVQLMEISHSLSGMEQEMEKLKSLEEANYKPESAPKQRLLKESTKPEPPSRGSEKETKEVERKKKETIIKTTTPEGKAEKIERLKSGFRICKPQGTFLWPDMAMSPPATAVVPFDNLLVASTPSSSSHLLPPTPPPVKPFAEKPPHPAAPTLTKPITKPCNPGLFMINLNELPTNQNEPKNPAAIPCLIPSVEQCGEVERQKIIRECELKSRGGSSFSSSSSSSCLSTKAGIWMAMATPNSPLGRNLKNKVFKLGLHLGPRR